MKKQTIDYMQIKNLNEMIQEGIILKNNVGTYILEPLEGQQKSFYNKALVHVYPTRITLQSYNTYVIEFRDGKLINLWNGYSATTQRHIKAFCGLNKKDVDKLELEY